MQRKTASKITLLKTLSLTFLLLLSTAEYVSFAFAHNAPFPTGYDPTHFVIDQIGEPETLDPAWAYDTYGEEIIFNVYETLVFYDTVWTDGPYNAGKGDVFKPMLATDVAILAGPSSYVKTFYFKIRGVGTSHTFQTTTNPVDLYKDGQIYSNQLFARDPEYGMVGKGIGPVRPAAEIPAFDGEVDRSDATGKTYPQTGATLWDKIEDTTWIDTSVSPNEKVVVRSVTDTNGNGVLDAGDRFDVVRKTTGNLRWNVREYWTVASASAGPPYTVTTTDDPVYFHNGAALTPEDVEYSFERAFVQDRSGGPTWMLWYPTQGLYSALSPGDDPNFGAVIDDMVGSNATHAWISLKTDFPEMTFLQILSQSWSSILNKDWCVAEADFDGDFVGHTWQYIWDTWHDPGESFIENDMMGTGPFAFSYWEEGTAYSVVRNTNYWDGWPALVTATGKERIGGYLDRVSWFLKTNWDDRRARFLAGDSDTTVVPRQYRDQVLGQVVGGELIRCYYPIQPVLAVDAMFFNFYINPQSTYLGPGFDPNNPYMIAGDRIPIDLFSDIHMRNAFTAAFDYDTFLAAAYLGEAYQPSDPIIPGLSYDNVAQAKPTFDMAKAEAELKLAWVGHPDDDPNTPEGAVWDKGMSFVLLYNAGNVARETAVTMLANNINSLNNEFHLTVQEVAWRNTYLPQMAAGTLPLFGSGSRASYSDPDNFAFPLMHTFGTFSAWQSYSNLRVDALIEAGALMPPDTNPYGGELDQADPRPYMNNWDPDLIAADPHNCIPPDTNWPRRSVYYELQAIYAIDDVPGFALSQEVGRHFEQAWMRGWYYNPLYPGEYVYHRWKAKTHFGDVNNDGAVNILDEELVSASWTKPTPDSPLGPVGYTPQADLTGGTAGTPDAGTGLVVGVPDGKVTVVDARLVSAYWDGPPTGLSHPSPGPPGGWPGDSSPPLPIGDPNYLQTNPFESNPTSGVTSGVVGLVGTVSSAMDGDFGTNLDWRIGGALPSITAYVELTSFENTPPTTFTIGWVDIKMNYRALIATTPTMDDRYRIVYQVAPSTTWLVLQDWTSGQAAKFDYNGVRDERAWSNVAEPNDGVWTWTDIGNVKVRVETRRQGTTEDLITNRFYLHDVWLTIYEGTYPPAGNVSIQPRVVAGLGVGQIFFIDVFATDVVDLHGVQFLITYNTTVLTALGYFAYNPFITGHPSEINDDPWANETGYVSVAFSSYSGDLVGFTGSGPVLRIYFFVDADGWSLLHFTQSILGNTLGEPITHTVSDGLFVTLADVAVTSITPSKTVVGQGYSMSIDVVVENHGLSPETFNVAAYYDTNVIGTQTVNNLPPGNSITLTFPWDTTGVAKNSYTISAHAWPVPGETNTADNTYANGIIVVATPGDVDTDGVVGIYDAAGVSSHWYPGPPIGPLGYNPNFDINNDGTIDIFDAAIVSAYWTGPPKGPLDP